MAHPRNGQETIARARGHHVLRLSRAQSQEQCVHLRLQQQQLAKAPLPRAHISNNHESQWKEPLLLQVLQVQGTEEQTGHGTYSDVESGCHEQLHDGGYFQRVDVECLEGYSLWSQGARGDGLHIL